ncbi:MAG: iron ABC transporter permease, partial [Boseongicola sp. SB0667_bin_21]|nr:iron ABC transporter permease [Boseongicola sp. SB0667_bin_21]
MTPAKATQTPPVLIFWIVAGWVGFVLCPWYGVEDGFFSFEWLVDGYPFEEDYSPAAFLIGQGEKLWLAPLLIPLLLPFLALGREKSDPTYFRILTVAGALGFGWLIIQGFSI